MTSHAHRPGSSGGPVRPQVAATLMVVGVALAVLAASAPLWWPGAASRTPAGNGAVGAGQLPEQAPEEPVPVEEAAAVAVDPRRALTLRGLAVLRRWDARRAAAYAEGDLEDLRALYTPASRAGSRDRALLARYAARGLTVRGLAPQIRSVDVTAARPGRLRVEVEERYPGLVVEQTAPSRTVDTGRAGERRYRSRAVVLRRTSGGWRVAVVERA